MQTALKIQQTWTPHVPHTLIVVLTSAVLTLFVIALMVVFGLLMQELMAGGGVPYYTRGIPEPGLDL